MANTPGIEARTRMALGALDALARSAEDCMGAAVARAPVAEGTLRGSATVTLIVNGARLEGGGARAAAQTVVRALVTAGRPITMNAEIAFNTVYSARQHEELTWKHPKGGQAKYLESVLLERGARYAALIQKAAGGAL